MAVECRSLILRIGAYWQRGGLLVSEWQGQAASVEFRNSAKLAKFGVSDDNIWRPFVICGLAECLQDTYFGHQWLDK